MRTELAALVGSRICHDLISPIGAISNGVELLSLTDNGSSAEMRLIGESVDNASARIRFFRIAYGAASEEQSVGRSEVLSILGAVARGGRFNYVWQLDEDARRLDVRLAFLVFQCFETALPMGGDITVERDQDVWTLTAVGRTINAEPVLWDRFGGEVDAADVRPAHVHFALLHDACNDAKRRMLADIQTDRVVVRF